MSRNLTANFASTVGAPESDADSIVFVLETCDERGPLPDLQINIGIRSSNSLQESEASIPECVRDDVECVVEPRNATAEFVCDCSGCFPATPWRDSPRRNISDTALTPYEKVNNRYTETHFELGSEGENYQSDTD